MATDTARVIEGPEAPHAHHSTGIKWFDVAMTLSVLMVSIASLVISLHTGSAMTELVHENARLVRASSTPLLYFSTGNATDDGKPEISFTLRNSGTGPARIVWLQILNRGVPRPNLIDLIKSTGVSYPKSPVTFGSSYITRTIVSAGEERRFLRWGEPAEGDPQRPTWQALDKVRLGFKTEACYCSLLGECWHSTLDGDIPQPVPMCTPPAQPSFGDPSSMK
ncbi:MAG: hypothetical protein ABIP33_10210 [Pseudolysinimonas sp.]